MDPFFWSIGWKSFFWFMQAFIGSNSGNEGVDSGNIHLVKGKKCVGFNLLLTVVDLGFIQTKNEWSFSVRNNEWSCVCLYHKIDAFEGSFNQIHFFFFYSPAFEPGKYGENGLSYREVEPDHWQPGTKTGNHTWIPLSILIKWAAVAAVLCIHCSDDYHDLGSCQLACSPLGLAVDEFKSQTRKLLCWGSRRLPHRELLVAVD